MYLGHSDSDYEAEAPIGVLLVNLGTPDEPTTPALRRYLKEFLWDRRVIERSRVAWWFILNGIVLRTRPARSAELYQQIWSAQGSPLLIVANKQAAALQSALNRAVPGRFVVGIGMRYGKPSIEGVLTDLHHRRIRNLLVLPLYPQYSATSTGSSFDAVVAALQKWRLVPEFRMRMSYYDHPLFIQALARSVREEREKIGTPSKLVISFHGIPKSYALAGDPYEYQCQTTARLLAQALCLTSDKYAVTFQSQFGKEEWLKPSTIEYITELGKQKMSCLHVICPGFSADCLETLEEINVVNRKAFLHAGGGEFHYIPALNDRPYFVDALVQMILDDVHGWVQKYYEDSYRYSCESARLGTN